MKEKITVNIAGNELTVLTDESEEYVNSLAQILDRRIVDMTITKNLGTKNEVILLCAMDYLDMSVKLKAEVEDLKAKLNEQAKKDNGTTKR